MEKDMIDYDCNYVSLRYKSNSEKQDLQTEER